jgi:two-component system chemotaxis response regulator CheB
VSRASALPRENQARDLVVIGASAGGVEALKTLVARLPADIPAAICIVLHLAPTRASALAGILGRAGDLPCRSASDGERLRPGHILVAPPDHHLVVEDGRVRLTAGPRENGHRPAVDTLFRSAAHVREAGVVGVVLSGTRDDGAAGLAAIKSRGGLAIVQDPADALYPGMPANAIAHVEVDAIAPIDLVAETIVALVVGGPLPDDVQGSDPAVADPIHESTLTLVCPECGGVLSEGNEGGMPQWQCHIGHAYSPDSLAEAQGAAVEAALWTALRSLEDRAALMRRLAEQGAQRGRHRSSALFAAQAEDAQAQAILVRGVVRDASAAAQRNFDEGDTDAPMTTGETA